MHHSLGINQKSSHSTSTFGHIGVCWSLDKHFSCVPRAERGCLTGLAQLPFATHYNTNTSPSLRRKIWKQHWYKIQSNRGSYTMTPKSGKPTGSVAQVTNVAQRFARFLNETRKSHLPPKVPSIWLPVNP